MASDTTIMDLNRSGGDDGDHTLILQKFVSVWREKFSLAKEAKNVEFDKVAKVAKKYYTGSHDFIYDSSTNRSVVGFSGMSPSVMDEDSSPNPMFRVTFNKVAEFVQIYGPILYHRNPTRVVRQRESWKPPQLLITGPEPTQTQVQMGDQMALSQFMQGFSQLEVVKQQQSMVDATQHAKADLIERLLNYTPNELDLKEEMRLAVDEALVQGRGCAWTEVYVPKMANRKLIGTFFGRTDELLIDPDVTRLSDAKWIARRCVEPTWKVERDYNLPPDSLQGVMDSAETKAYVSSTEEGGRAKRQGQTCDLITYYKVWSKMGMGVRLKNSGLEDPVIGDASALTEQMGDYVYLVIAPNMPYPINMPEMLVKAAFEDGNPEAVQALLPHVQWPIPLWADDEWPLTVLDFHPLADKAWPMNHLQPALGEQTFLDWAYSFLAGKIRNTCRDFIAIAKAAGEEVRTTIKEGRDLTILELESSNKNIGEMIQFLQHPPINQDVFRIIQAVELNFDKRTGLSEAMYGSTSSAMRSAQEAALKGDMLKIRPDDMSERVEHFATSIARKEAIASRVLLTGQDIQPIFGDYAAMFWDQNVYTQDLQVACSEFDYRIEASSARKPNKDFDVINSQESSQFLFPALMQFYQGTGNATQVNAFIRYWANARNLDVEKFLFPEVPPAVQQMQQMQQPPPPQAPEGQQMPQQMPQQ